MLGKVAGHKPCLFSLHGERGHVVVMDGDKGDKEGVRSGLESEFTDGY